MKNNKSKKILARLDSIRVSRPQSLLVFETTGFSLYGALFSTGLRGSVTQQAVGKSNALDFSIAVAEVLEQLGGQTKKRLPKNVVLITPSAASGLLHLPVNPNKPRPREQMSELVRWEIEPMFARQSAIWFIGALLMGRGFINAKQRQEVAAGAGTNVRFGQEACNLGYIIQDQIDECLALQEQLALFDDDLITGWVGQSGNQEGEEDGLFNWYGVGFGETMRKCWRKAFQQQGLALSWVYPQIGLASTAIQAGGREWILVDIRQEQFAVLRGQSGNLNSLRIESWQDGHVNLDLVGNICQEEMHSDIKDVYLTTPDNSFEEISSGLGRLLSREVLSIPLAKIKSEISDIPDQILASLTGAATHAFGLCEAGMLPRVMAQPPKLQLWRRRELWLPVAVMVLILSVVGFDGSMRYHTWANEKELQKLDALYKEKVVIKKKIEEATGEVARLEKQLNKKKSLVEQQRLRRHILKDVILYRQVLIPGLLQAISEAIGDAVVLDTVKEEKRRSGFLLVGLALTNTDGQLFIKRLNTNLKPWRYHVSDVKIKADQGRLDITGYILRIMLMPTPIEDVVDQG